MGECGERIVMLRRKKYDEEGEKGVQDRKVGLLWCGGWRLDCCPLAHLLSRRYACWPHASFFY